MIGANGLVKIAQGHNRTGHALVEVLVATKKTLLLSAICAVVKVRIVVADYSNGVKSALLWDHPPGEVGDTTTTDTIGSGAGMVVLVLKITHRMRKTLTMYLLQPAAGDNLVQLRYQVRWRPQRHGDGIGCKVIETWCQPC